MAFSPLFIRLLPGSGYFGHFSVPSYPGWHRIGFPLEAVQAENRKGEMPSPLFKPRVWKERLCQTHAVHQLPRKASCDVWGDGWSVLGGAAQRPEECEKGDHLTFPHLQGLSVLPVQEPGWDELRAAPGRGAGRAGTDVELLGAGNPISEHISFKPTPLLPYLTLLPAEKCLRLILGLKISFGVVSKCTARWEQAAA